MTAIPPLGKGTIQPFVPPTGAPPGPTSFSDLLDGKGTLVHPIAKLPPRIGGSPATRPVQPPLTIEAPAEPAPVVGITQPVESPVTPVSLPNMPGLVVPPKAVPLAAAAAVSPGDDTAPEMFDNATPKPPKPDRVFTFEELGMFGQYAAQFAPAAKTVGPAEALALSPSDPQPIVSHPRAGASPFALPTPVPGGTHAPGGSWHQSHTPANAPDDGGVVVETDRIAVPEVATETHLLADRAAPSLVAVEDLAAGTPSAEDGGETLFASAGQPGKLLLRSTMAAAQANALNVTVAEEGDAALSVAVRAEGGESFGKLRQIVQDTAAEFGLDVAEFRLNGATSESSPFHTMTGGNRGRSR